MKPKSQFVPLVRLRARLDTAIRICRGLYYRYQHVTDYKKLLVKALYNRTEFELRTSNAPTPIGLDLADDLIREAVALQRPLCGQFPDSLEPQIVLNKLLHRLSEVHDRLGRIRDAQKVLEGATQDFERFLTAHPQFTEGQRGLIDDYEYLGLLFEKTGQTQEAEAAFDKAEELSKQLNHNIGPPPNESRRDMPE